RLTRVGIGVVSLQPVAARQVDLDDDLGINLGQIIIRRDVQVQCVSVEIVQVEQHAAAGLAVKGIEEGRLAHVRLGDRREDGAVLKQDRPIQRLAQLAYLASDDIESLLVEYDRQPHSCLGIRNAAVGYEEHAQGLTVPLVVQVTMGG